MELSILFIEDDKVIRENYLAFLKQKFEKVYEAEDGLNAYQIYLEKKPDILIIDIDLPKLNGLELLKKIREKDLSTKAIMFTGNTDTSFLLQAAELKLTKYLVKPVSKNELKDALNLVKDEMRNFQVLSKETLILKDNYSWNYTNKELFLNNQIINLTKTEVEILNKLFKNTSSTTSYDELLIDIWETFDASKVDLVKTAIKKLRKKLPCETIVNIYGQGYKVNVK